MRAAANKGARLVEAIQFMEDIKGWDTAVAGVCTIAEQALRGKPNSIEEFNGMPRSSRREYTRKAGELHSKVSAITERNWMAIGAHLSAELITKLTFSKKVKAFAEFPEAEQGTTIRRLNQKVYKRCAAPPGIGRNRDPVSTMQLSSQYSSCSVLRSRGRNETRRLRPDTMFNRRRRDVPFFKSLAGAHDLQVMEMGARGSGIVWASQRS
ncbi:hypothetical protein M747DRAFT_237198 [Aspergillus niger ATCC 13496]|uniref:Uncharacterized protein n=4 Tax=Aspergillus niger TaxID=5061 RepID=A2R946_ASPNC|nr:hypothetical protein An17g00070 [Aspergillus niger]RDH20587.1 hypothetical protein M747DRAFT_237198 [Aspergillus niger ATCC 13496]CAK47137.1 hypothetical protein An17g00070 [Aspergillus niger]